jgi:signal peptide peptidase SppA
MPGSYPLFTSRLLGRPQLITPSAGRAVAGFLLDGSGLRVDGFDGSVQQRDPRAYSVAEHVAVVPIVGELVHRGGGMDALSGVTSYEALQDMCVDALNDPTVAGLLLDIDSPGGEAGGNMDFASWLASMRGIKPVVAFVNSQACSGAYSIASSADQVIVCQDGLVGSIGVVTYHIDASRQLANDGVVVTYIYAGDRKIDGNPAEPLTPPALAQIEGIVQGIYSRFVSVVSNNRGLTIADVVATQAAIYQGQDAVASGLADAIGTWEDAYMLASTPTTRTAPVGVRQSLLAAAANLGTVRMSGSGAAPAPAAPAAPAPPPPAPPAPPAPPVVVPPAQPAPAVPAEPGQPGEPGALPADTDPGQQRQTPPHSPGFGPGDPADVAEACAAAGFAEMTSQFIRSGATMAAVKGRLGEAKEIQTIADTVGLPKMAGPIIKLGLSVADARTHLFEAKAGKDAGVRTDTTPPTAHTQGGDGRIDAGSVYSKFNAPKEPGRRSAA